MRPSAPDAPVAAGADARARACPAASRRPARRSIHSLRTTDTTQTFVRLAKRESFRRLVFLREEVRPLFAITGRLGLWHKGGEYHSGRPRSASRPGSCCKDITSCGRAAATSWSPARCMAAFCASGSPGARTAEAPSRSRGASLDHPIFPARACHRALAGRHPGPARRLGSTKHRHRFDSGAYRAKLDDVIRFPDHAPFELDPTAHVE